MDAERVKEELEKLLNEYQVGEMDLDEVFAPLLEACSKVARNDKEFIQCINESITTLKSVLRKARK